MPLKAVTPFAVVPTNVPAGALAAPAGGEGEDVAVADAPALGEAEVETLGEAVGLPATGVGEPPGAIEPGALLVPA
jgi:hypothetical protein